MNALNGWAGHMLMVAMIGLAMPGMAALGQAWRTVTVTYECKNPEKPNDPATTQTTKLSIPGDLKEGEAIRGLMPDIRDLRDFALRNRIAMYDGCKNAEFGLPPQEMLDAAAKASEHPELKYAGSILQGLSSKGRVAAHAAAFHPERVIAVLLDHSWTPPGPTGKPTKYEYGQLPEAPGVPYFFNASRSDTFQNFDRRKLHYQWCTAAFRTRRQPCTATIHHENVNHNNAGNRQLQAVWLEEVLALRVPAKIPTDGSPYRLIPVDPMRTGGLVLASLGQDSAGVTIHTDVSVAPVSMVTQPTKCNWWVPGPKSAKMYLDWVKRNGGKVNNDLTDKFPQPR